MNIKNLQGPYKHVFMSEEEIKAALEQMENDPSLNTGLSYVRNSDPAIQVGTFTEMHLKYLQEHPKTNPEHYLSNLRTMIRSRT